MNIHTNPTAGPQAPAQQPLTMGRRGFLGRTAAALAAGAGVNVTAIAVRPALAGAIDPVFAVIDAHRRAYAETKIAVNAHAVAEDELAAAGNLYPQVVSRGNPASDLPRPVSRTHIEIDMYSPADLFPDDNKREHAELQASMDRRDARNLDALEEAIGRAWDAEVETILDLVETSPTTFEGLLALIVYEQDELWEHRRELVEAGHLDVLCCSIRTALEVLLYPSA